MNETNLSVLTLRQAARRYRIPEPWLRAEAKAGRLPCVESGGVRLVNPERLEAFLAERMNAEAEKGGANVAK
ncbi:MAG: helix-turn-helix domain-containing protein [Phycisphaerales bacterium]